MSDAGITYLSLGVLLFVVLLCVASRNTGHMTGGKGWYSDNKATPAELAQMEEDQSMGLAAAVEAGLIAPMIPPEALELMRHPGAVYENRNRE